MIVAVGVGQDGVRPGLDQRAIALLALLERLHRASPLGDVGQSAHTADRAALVVEMDAAGRLHPALRAVIGSSDPELGTVAAAARRLVGAAVALADPIAVVWVDQ